MGGVVSSSMARLAFVSGIVAVGCVGVGVGSATAQEPTGEAVSRISVTWTEAPIRDVLQAFAAFSGRSIVAGANVGGFVTADINDRPWDVSLRAVLSSLGLVAIEDEYGIIRVEDMRTVADREQIEVVTTRSYRLSYVKASEIQATIEPLLSDRGSVSVVETTNTIVVSDVPRVHRVIARLIGR